MSKKVTFDAKGHEAILDALRKEFDLVVAPRGQYVRILRNGKLAGWLTATKKHVRVRVGGGTQEAVNVATAAQAYKPIRVQEWERRIDDAARSLELAERYMTWLMVLLDPGETAELKSIAAEMIYLTGWLDATRDKDLP